MKPSLWFLIPLMLLVLPGCAITNKPVILTPSHTPTPSSTSTLLPIASQTSTQETPTSTPLGLIPGLPKPDPDGFLLSPDGSSLIEWTLGVHRTIEMFSLKGQLLGRYDSPNQMVLCADWLLDSSGVYLWTLPDSWEAKPGPIVLMDKAGTIHLTGMDGLNPELSPDGGWIAATLWGGSVGYDGVEVVSTSGGPVHQIVLEAGGRFLGWDGSYLIYFAPGGIFSKPHTGGIPLLLIPFSPDDSIDLDQNPIYSPDGQVTIVNN